MERNLLLLVLLINQLYARDTFWFSYKSISSNSALIYEQKNISPIVIPTLNSKISTCKIKIKQNPNKTKLQTLNDNFNKILPCFYKTNIILISRSTVSTSGVKDVVEVTIAPIRFIVDFKDDFANITILKREKN